MSEAQNESEKKPAKKRSKLLLLGIPLFVLTGAAAGGWWFFGQPAAAAEAAAEDEAPGTAETQAGLVPLDPFIVNLADSRKYLRVTMVLLVADEHTATEAEESKLTISLIRSSIIELLTTQTSTVLSTAEGRRSLKLAVAKTAKEAGHLDVHDVLFEEFIVQ